ncbi:MAG: sugar phosphate isomerase/epimerase [Chthoniobacter sp.]|nr:sugar phosphate isomerase/epimerase [Chthoniobacter sp.]
MSDWPVGLSTGCFYQKSIFDCLDLILAGGFSLIEICSSPAHLDYHDSASLRRVAERLEALGIGAYSFHAPFADHIDITALDAEQRATSVHEVLVAAEAAAVLRSRHFVIHPGPEHQPHPSGSDRQHRLENVARSLDEIAKRCQQLGLTCVLENKLPHLIFGNTADMLWILGAMTVTDVGVCLDTGHAHLAGELDTATHKLSRHLRMIHASDNRGHGDDHLPPGQGEIDWPRFLRLLRNSGFRGSIMMEIAGHGEPAQILEAARKARQFLRRAAWRLG